MHIYMYVYICTYIDHIVDRTMQKGFLCQFYFIYDINISKKYSPPCKYSLLYMSAFLGYGICRCMNIHVFACIYVYMYVCIYMCIYIYMCVYVYIYGEVCVHYMIYKWVCMGLFMYVYNLYVYVESP